MIKSIADLAEKLQKLGEPEKGYTRFFRGHSDESYILEPSIYRQNDCKIDYEDQIIRDAFTYCSNSFLPHETLFEKLVKLQHYNYKTRLLDVSSNALVALYFSIGKSDKQEISHSDKNGEIVILDIPNEHIKYDDSDVVSILSAISLRHMNFNLRKYAEDIWLKAMLESALFIANEKANNPLYTKDFSNDEFLGPLIKSTGKTPQELLQFLFDNKTHELMKIKMNNHPEIVKLLHDIRQDKPSFEAVIEVKDLERVVCVRAKQNNPRISRQQGSFLLFGIKDKKTECAELPNDWIKRLEGKRFIIQAEKKESILNELKSFGTYHQSLFPELDSQAGDIMNKYK